MTAASAIQSCAQASPTTDGILFDRWRAARMIEARVILSAAASHRPTLVALAARVIADAPQIGGAA